MKPLRGATEEGQAPGWGHRGMGPNGEPKLVRFAKWLGFTVMFDKASCSGLEGQRADYGPCCLWHGKNNSSWHCAGTVPYPGAVAPCSRTRNTSLNLTWNWQLRALHPLTQLPGSDTSKNCHLQNSLLNPVLQIHLKPSFAARIPRDLSVAPFPKCLQAPMPSDAFALQLPTQG